MSEPRSPILWWISWGWKPGWSVSTRKQATPRWAFSGSVWAKISATLAWLPSEMNIFAPLITQPESVLRARVFWLAASEPVSGSVSPKHPSHSPEHSFGRYFCFCSSVPQRRIAEQTSEVCTEITVRIAEQPRPTSSTTSAVGQVVEAGAAVLAWHDRAEVALVGDLGHQLEVEVLVAIVLARADRRSPCR